MERQKFTKMMDLSERMYLRQEEDGVRVMDVCGEEYRQARWSKKHLQPLLRD